MKFITLCLLAALLASVSVVRADDATEHGSLVSRSWKPSTQVVSPHVPWMNPSVHGSMHVLVVQPWQNLREVVELAQRMEMTFDVIPVTSVGRNSIQTKGMFDYEREEFESKLPNADVLVMCGIPPQWLDDELWQKMLARVEQGMGLVWTVAVPEHERLADLLNGVSRTPAYLLRGAPYALLNRVDPYSAFRCTTRGNGRIAAWVAPNMFRFGWSTMTPVTPLAANEIYYGTVTRLVTWASRKPSVADVLLPQPSIELPAAQASHVKFNINAHKPISDATVICTIRDASTLWGAYKPDGPMHTLQWARQVGNEGLPVVQQVVERINLNAGGNEVKFDLPALQHGPYVLDVRLIDSKQRAVDWDATTLHIKSNTSLRWINLPADGISPTTESFADITFDSNGEASKTLQVHWKATDSHKRLLTQGNTSWNGQSNQRIHFTLEHALAKGVTLHVSLTDEGKVISTRQATGLVALERTKPFRYGVYEPLLARMQDLEVDTLVTSHANWMEDAQLAKHDLDAYFWLNGPVLYNASSNPKIRTPCFNDPAFRTIYENYLASIAPMLKRQRAVAGLIADEWDYPWNHNQYYGMRRAGKPGPLPDLCQCEFCLPKFRSWLKQAFNNNLSDLNAAWGSSFESWDVLQMPTLADVGKTVNSTATASRLRFGDFTTADFFSEVNRLAKEIVPSVRLGLSGTRPTDGLNGYDYAQLTQQGTGSFVHYGGPMVAQTLDFREGPESVFVSKWEGYSIWNGSNASAVMWRAFIQGQDGLIQYAAYPAYGTHHIDWTLGAGTKTMGEAFKEIDSGLSVLMSNADRRKSPIAIHYSPMSFALAAVGVVPDFNGTIMAKRMEELHQMLIDCGFDPIFMSSSMIKQGALASEGCKLLILPDSLSLGDDELEKILQFEKSGSKVLATSLAGLYNNNGLKRANPPEFQKLENFDYRHTQQDGLGGEIDVAVGHTNGQQAARNRIVGQLKQIGITPPILIEGQRQLVSQIVTHKQGGATYFMVWPGPFVHNDIHDRFKEQVRIAIPGTGMMYDVRAHKFMSALGERDALTLELQEGEPLIYAILPYKVTGLDLEVLSKSVAAGTKVRLSAAVRTDNPMLLVDHALDIKVSAPDGTVAKCYSRPVLAKDGTVEWIIPLALNEMAGRWEVHAHDIISGVTQTALFEVR